MKKPNVISLIKIKKNGLFLKLTVNVKKLVREGTLTKLDQLMFEISAEFF